jgi:DNA polymerase-3 subunit epsilon
MRKMLNRYLEPHINRFESAAPCGVVLDTLPINRKVFSGIANYKLEALVQHLKIPSDGAGAVLAFNSKI